MVIARHAPSTELGTFSIGLSIFWMTIGLMMSFVSTPLVLTVQGVSDEAYRSQVARGLGASLAIALLASIALLISAALTGLARPHASLSALLLVAACTVTPAVLREYGRAVAFAVPGLPVLVRMDVAFSSLSLTGLAALSYAGAIDGLRSLVMVGLASMISVAVWWLSTRAKLQWAYVSHALQFIRSHWRLSRWLCGTSVLYSLSVAALPLLLGLLAGPVAVGVYAAYASMAGLLNPIMIVGNNLTAPRCASAAVLGGGAAVRRVARSASLALAGALGLVGLLLCLGESSAIGVAYGARFSQHRFLLGLLVASTVSEGLGLGASWGLHAMGESRLAFWSRLAAVALTLPVGVMVMLRHGALGAAIQLLALRALNAAIGWAALRRMSSRGPRIPTMADNAGSIGSGTPSWVGQQGAT